MCIFLNFSRENLSKKIVLHALSPLFPLPSMPYVFVRSSASSCHIRAQVAISLIVETDKLASSFSAEGIYKVMILIFLQSSWFALEL